MTKILIAEDDSLLVRVLRHSLVNEGYDVLTASNGREALEYIEGLSGKLDVLITDIQMPEMDGLELIRRLKETKLKLPIVVMTNRGEKEVLLDLLRLGCDEFLEKPVRPADLKAKLETILVEVRDLAKKTETIGELSRSIKDYERSYQSLRREVDSAVQAYHGLISIKENGYKVPIAFRSAFYKDLGGDYLGVRDNAQGTRVFMADVAGHDLAASYHTVWLKAFFEDSKHDQLTGEEYLTILNKVLWQSGENERMVTAAYLSVDMNTRQLETWTAGHPQVLRYNTSGEVEMIPTEGSVLGLFEEVEFVGSRMNVDSGERYFICTDGIINACFMDGESGVRKVLSTDGLKDLIISTYTPDIDEHLGKIWDGVMRYCNRKRTDDMLLFVLEIP